MIRTRNCFLAVALCATVLLSPLLAAGASVSQRIPADATMYVVVNNMKTTGTRVDRFLQQTGFSMMLPPGGILEMIKMRMQIASEFTGDGPLAVAMLDPKDYGIDLEKMMEQSAADQQAEKPAGRDWPIVVYIAADSVESVFGAQAQADGDAYKVNFNGFPMTAKAEDGMIVMSGNPKALDAAMASEAAISKKIPPEQAGIMDKGDIAFFADMQKLGPLYKSMMQSMQKQMQASPQMPPMMNMSGVMNFYDRFLRQSDAIAMTLRMEESGIVLDELFSFREGTDMAKTVAAMPSGQDLSVNRVPDLPYVFAASMTTLQDEQAAKTSAKLAEELWSDLGISEELSSELAQITEVMNTQVKSYRMVIGGSTPESGSMGFSLVMDCKDAEKVRSTIGESADLVIPLIEAITSQKMQDLKVSYNAESLDVAGLSVDTIRVSHPKMDAMGPNQKQQLKAILGEEQPTARMATLDENTVLLTVGGADEFFSAAKTAAGKTEPLLASEITSAFDDYRPENQSVVMYFSLPNMVKVIMNTVQKMQPNAAGAMPFQLSTKTPITVLGGKTGNSVHQVMYVPTDLVREVSQIMMMFMQGMGGGMGAPGGAPQTGPTGF